MNKVILTGRLTKDPEAKYTQANQPMAVTQFSVAVNRKFKKDGEPDADFFNCVAFGKTAEFISKYFTKGQMIALSGALKNNSWTDNNGQKRISTEIYVEDAEFCGSKLDNGGEAGQHQQKPPNDDYYSVEEQVNEDNLPF